MNFFFFFLQMYGLSGINLDKVEVTRSENLTDYHINVVFGFDKLEINGSYAMKGFVGWITLDSKGEQPFSIRMVNATIAYQMKLELIQITDWNSPNGDQLLTFLSCFQVMIHFFSSSSRM